MRKNFIYLSFLMMTFCGCEKKEQSKYISSNPEFDVSLLFEIDGIKVYRFDDAGSCHYFCTSGRTISVKSKTSGKGRTYYTENIDTVDSSITE